MKYKEALDQSMKLLAKDKRTRFLGYNLVFASKFYGTLANVPKDKIMEMPLNEGLMTGTAIGLSLEGYKPVLCFERHDFLLLASDQIVNHLDKISDISKGTFRPKVLIRAIVGGTKPFDPGIQHKQNHTQAIRSALKNIPVFELRTPKEILSFYHEIKRNWHSAFTVEWRDLYDTDG